MTSIRIRDFPEEVVAWSMPIVTEVCVGMEVTSYESADVEVLFVKEPI